MDASTGCPVNEIRLRLGGNHLVATSMGRFRWLQITGGLQKAARFLATGARRMASMAADPARDHRI